MSRSSRCRRLTESISLRNGEYEGMAFHEWGADFPDANGMLLPLFLSD